MTYMVGNSVHSVHVHWLVAQSLRVSKCLGQFTVSVFLWTSCSFGDPQSFPQKTPRALSNVRLWVTASDSVRCWMDTLRGKYAKLLFGNIRKYFRSNYLQGLVLAYGMGLKSGRVLLGHSFILCFSFLPAFFVNRTNFVWEGFWFGWCNQVSTGGSV